MRLVGQRNSIARENWIFCPLFTAGTFKNNCNWLQFFFSKSLPGNRDRYSNSKLHFLFHSKQKIKLAKLTNLFFSVFTQSKWAVDEKKSRSSASKRKPRVPQGRPVNWAGGSSGHIVLTHINGAMELPCSTKINKKACLLWLFVSFQLEAKMFYTYNVLAWLEDDMSKGTNGEVLHISTVESLLVHSKVTKETDVRLLFVRSHLLYISPLVMSVTRQTYQLPQCRFSGLIPSTARVGAHSPKSRQTELGLCGCVSESE